MPTSEKFRLAGADRLEINDIAVPYSVQGKEGGLLCPRPRSDMLLIRQA